MSAEHFPLIRRVTPDTFQVDIAAGRVVAHPDVIADIPHNMMNGIADWFIAEDKRGEPRGQVSVRWPGPINPDLRAVLGLGPNEYAPNIAFMEVPEVYRRLGYGRALLRRALQAANELAAFHPYPRAFLSVALGNTAARNLYVAEGFETTGFIRQIPQFERSPDGTYGDSVEMSMEYFTKELTPSSPQGAR